MCGAVLHSTAEPRQSAGQHRRGKGDTQPLPEARGLRWDMREGSELCPLSTQSLRDLPLITHRKRIRV